MLQKKSRYDVVISVEISVLRNSKQCGTRVPAYHVISRTGEVKAAGLPLPHVVGSWLADVMVATAVSVETFSRVFSVYY